MVIVLYIGRATYICTQDCQVVLAEGEPGNHDVCNVYIKHTHNMFTM